MGARTPVPSGGFSLLAGGGGGRDGDSHHTDSGPHTPSACSHLTIHPGVFPVQG